MIAEIVLPPARAVSYHGEALEEAHLPHNFVLTQLGRWTAEEVRVAVEAYEAVLPNLAWPNWLVGDHDFSRTATRLGPTRSRLAQMLLLTLRGTPTCYYGDELGMVDGLDGAGTPGCGVVDPQAATGADRDRLVARTPMQWSIGPHAGFSRAEPWLPVASADPALTVEHQRRHPSSQLLVFRSLLRLRRQIPAIAVGAYVSLPSPLGVFSFERWHPQGSIEVHLNFGEDACEVELRSPGRVLLTTSGGFSSRPDRRLVLCPDGGAIVQPCVAR